MGSTKGVYKDIIILGDLCRIWGFRVLAGRAFGL